MTETKKIDARGLGCPQPVVLAKKALEQYEQVVITVDEEIALENVKRMGLNAGCDVQVDKKGDGTYDIRMVKTGAAGVSTNDQGAIACEKERPQTGPFVVVFAENRMGRGSDELGAVLIRMFIHTLCGLDGKPDAMIFYNTGVKLTVKGSEVLDDLNELARSGVKMLVCGTCTKHFNITNDVAVGTISNMYDITECLSRAGRLVYP